MRFGILITSGLSQRDLHTASRLARAALSQGHEVRLFVMGDGVQHLADHPKNPSRQDLQELLEAGVEVACCAMNSELRGLTRDRLVPGVSWRSQDDHARIVNWSDRYLAFGS
jgi:sulfur relay (sulfurtransferase) complex TusBCD TusD component (DsrE family)